MENKFKSRKFVAAIWAGLVFSLFGTISLATKDTPDWMGICMPILCSIVLGFVGGQSWIDRNK